MKKLIYLLGIFAFVICISISCKRCLKCTYTDATGTELKYPEACGDDMDATEQECIDKALANTANQGYCYCTDEE